MTGFIKVIALVSFILVLPFVCLAETQQISTGTKMLSEQLRSFSGTIKWTVIMQTAGVDVAKLEEMSGSDAYRKLYEGKAINELPNLTLSRYEYTTGTLQPNLTLYDYTSQAKIPIGKELAKEINKATEKLTRYQEIKPVVPFFDFNIERDETLTSAGIQWRIRKPGNQVETGISSKGNLDTLLYGVPNPLRWPLASRDWHKIMHDCAIQLKNSPDQTSCSAMVGSQKYNLSFDGSGLLYSIISEKPEPGGWTLRFRSTFYNWKWQNGTLLYGLKLVKGDFVYENKVAPLIQYYIFCSTDGTEK